MTNRAGPTAESQLRKHYFLDNYVVIAPRRSQRPKRDLQQALVSEKSRSQHPIEQNPALYQVSDESGSWRVKVVENDYPAFSPENGRARGKQELVLETNQANRPFHSLSVPEIENVLGAYKSRLQALRESFRYVAIFKNHGRMAGASLDHTHSQIIATDIAPPTVVHERQALAHYQHLHRSSPFCDIIRWELNHRQRIIAHTRFTTTICPYASQFPLEAWIIPNRQNHSLTDLDQRELRSLADHLKGITSALGGNGIDYNYHLQEAIPGSRNHFYIKVVPRISIPGGYELNTGIQINPVTPEYAVAWYQKHVRAPHAV